MYDKGKKPCMMTEQRGYHGSPKETHKTHGGKVAGTKELSIGSMPGGGKTGMGVRPKEAKSSIEKNSGKSAPKGMKRYSEE